MKSIDMRAQLVNNLSQLTNPQLYDSQSLLNCNRRYGVNPQINTNPSTSSNVIQGPNTYFNPSLLPTNSHSFNQSPNSPIEY